MYAFTSTSDFDGKTGYVTDIAPCSDWYSNGCFYPAEPAVLFDDLFVRFKSQIENALNGGGFWTTGPLHIGRMKVLDRNHAGGDNPELTDYYLTTGVSAASNGVTVFWGYCKAGQDPTKQNFCSAADYFARNHQYNIGKIFLVRWRVLDTTNGGFVTNQFSSEGYLGDVGGYIGTYHNPTSSYPTGWMDYAFSTYTTIDSIIAGTASQTGYPNTQANRANQPELVGKYAINSDEMSGLFWGDWYRPIITADDGSYDPDPPPPPPPPWDPDDGDPTKDDHDEPGDDPPVRPGDKERKYDPVPIPGLPSVTSVGAGFTTLYRPSQAMLQLFASQLYDSNIIQQIVNYVGSVQEMVAGLAIVPFQPPVNGRAKHRIGLVTINVEMDKISNQFVSINCGDIAIEPYYNNFLDYTPYTKLILWLPYIGYQEISADEVMGHTINVTYHCDCLSGACVAFVSTGVVGATGPQIPRVLGQFSGNCMVQVPTASASYDTMISSAINILTTAVGVAGGAAVGAANVAAMESAEASAESIKAAETSTKAHTANDIAGSGASLITSMKPNVNRNGTPGSSAGYMSVQTPYLIRFTPRQSLPTNYITQRGYPSNKGGTLSSFSGYCEVEDIQLNNVPATIGEINEIYKLLRGGVLL